MGSQSDSVPLYLQKPWLRLYPKDIPAEIDIPEVSLCELFDEAARRWRDRTALIFYGTKISYGELKDKVDRFATALSHIGIGKGDRVALLLLNSPQYYISFYGVLKVGAVVVPVSTVYVSPEIRYQLQDSGAEGIICMDFLYEGFRKTEVEMKNVIITSISDYLPAKTKLRERGILRDEYQRMALPPPGLYDQKGHYRFQELIKRYPPEPFKIDLDPKEDLVALPYTGGTTGLPKGVMITHYNCVAAVKQLRAFRPFWEDGKEVQVGYMPYYHIGGQLGAVMGAVATGDTVVVITTPDLDTIIDAIIDYKATFFGGAPSIFELLKIYNRTSRVNWRKMKLITTGADAIHESTYLDWQRRTGTTLHDFYGMTETTGTGIAAPPGQNKAGSIGIPLPSTMAAVLDPEKDEFMPVGEIGEITIKGPQVCKGYWNKPEATKECEAILNGERWWRTGDLGRMDEEGRFYIYDRKRDLIKYKGLRVYAREVEEVLKLHPKIKEVGVVGVKDVAVGENVKAFVVLHSDARGKVSEADIAAYCKDKLAPYKIPKIIEFVGEIPKTDVGKVSRRELREIGEI